MLTRLGVDGFKNLLDFKIDIGPLTCVAGPNGVGKSNVFDAIRFLWLLSDHSIKEAATMVRGSDVETSDCRDSAPRYSEISEAVSACGPAAPWVAIVPVQDTEAWLLLDDIAIRKVAARPRATSPVLAIRAPRQAEDRANPDELLREPLVKAANVSGRRLPRFRADFPEHRRKLLESLGMCLRTQLHKGPQSRVRRAPVQDEYAGNLERLRTRMRRCRAR